MISSEALRKRTQTINEMSAQTYLQPFQGGSSAPDLHSGVKTPG